MMIDWPGVERLLVDWERLVDKVCVEGRFSIDMNRANAVPRERCGWYW
jgi:hypothetical protein